MRPKTEDGLVRSATPRCAEARAQRGFALRGRHGVRPLGLASEILSHFESLGHCFRITIGRLGSGVATPTAPRETGGHGAFT